MKTEIKFHCVDEVGQLHVVYLHVGKETLLLGRAMRSVVDLFSNEEIFMSDTGREGLWFSDEALGAHLLQAFFSGAGRASVWSLVAQRDSGATQLEIALKYLKHRETPVIEGLNPRVFYQGDRMLESESLTVEASDQWLPQAIADGDYLWRRMPGGGGECELGFPLGNPMTIRRVLQALGFEDMVNWETGELLAAVGTKVLLKSGSRVCLHAGFRNPQWVNLG